MDTNDFYFISAEMINFSYKTIKIQVRLILKPLLVE